MNFFINALAGLAAGILSAWGIGGGSLLMVYMTGFAGIAQVLAQGINLLYFLPVSAGGLYSHMKNGLVDKKAAAAAICAGIVCAAAAALIANALDLAVLRRLFGIFLIFIGLHELFAKERRH